MDEQTKHEAHQWLLKADHDLRSAARLMYGGDEPILDTAVYHCQQAAEKALKAYLTGNGVIFPKMHLLSSILELCMTLDETFVSVAGSR